MIDSNFWLGAQSDGVSVLVMDTLGTQTQAQARLDQFNSDHGLHPLGASEDQHCRAVRVKAVVDEINQRFENTAVSSSTTAHSSPREVNPRWHWLSILTDGVMVGFMMSAM